MMSLPGGTRTALHGVRCEEYKLLKRRRQRLKLRKEVGGFTRQALVSQVDNSLEVKLFGRMVRPEGVEPPAY